MGEASKTQALENAEKAIGAIAARHVTSLPYAA